MSARERAISTIPVLQRWLRFVVGLVVLALSIAFFASGYSPPGIFGEVLRHNQEHDIDASPLFYTEVENMHELEAGLLRSSTRDSHDSSAHGPHG